MRGSASSARGRARAAYGDSICEAHHIVWLSRGGEDALANLVLLESESSPGGAWDG